MNEEKPYQTFSTKEVEELLKLVTEKEEVIAQKEANGGIEVYDFRKPERVSKDQLHIMSMFYEGFARNLATDLSTLIRGIVESEVKISEQMIFSEFIASIPNPTCITLLSFEGQEKTTYLDFNYSILFPLIDRIIGGPGHIDAVPTRTLTEIEWELANSILSIIIDNLNKSWAQIKNMNFVIIRQDSNPFLIQPLQPNEPII
ncbi:MAG: flagellar motor switch protein FliM, partial [Planctomycetota bacterium]